MRVCVFACLSIIIFRLDFALFHLCSLVSRLFINMFVFYFVLLFCLCCVHNHVRFHAASYVCLRFFLVSGSANSICCLWIVCCVCALHNRVFVSVSFCVSLLLVSSWCERTCFAFCSVILSLVLYVYEFVHNLFRFCFALCYLCSLFTRLCKCAEICVLPITMFGLCFIV